MLSAFTSRVNVGCRPPRGGRGLKYFFEDERAYKIKVVLLAEDVD